MAPPKVTQWVNENFPKPRVDPEWLDGCCEWLIGDQHIDPVTSFPEFTHQVKDQLLQSDLRDSMMHGTGLDVHIDKFTGNLRGPPVLVQIMAITDTGVSAYQLEQVRASREEHILSGDGDEEGEEDGDVDIEGEGPMPKYPRGSLRLRLSDGVTKLEAMEYRPLPQISLGPTPLGYKLQLKGTLIRNGMAFLEPSTVVFLGGAQEQLEAQQLEDFKRGLRVRLGLPVEDEPEAPALAAAAAPARPVAAAARSPLRDISPPSPPLFPQHDDDMSLGARRRRVPELPSTSTNIGASSSKNVSGNIKGRPIIGLPRGRKSNASTTSNGNRSQSDEPDLDLEIEGRHPSATERNTLTKTAASQKNNMTSSHFNKINIKCDPDDPDDLNMDVENLDFNFSPTTRQSTRLYRPPSPSTSLDIPLSAQIQRQDKSFDFDLLDEIDPDENQPPPLARQTQPKKPSSFSTLPPSRDLKGKGRAKSSSGSLSKVDDASSDDYGMMGIDDNDFADADFLANLSRVEKEALMSGRDANESQVSNAGGVDSSFIGCSSGSFVVVDGDKKSSSSGSAPIPPSSSSSKATEQLEIIEIGSSDDEMLGTDDKENEPVATRHVKRRTEDLDAGARERGRGLVASQGWNPGSGGATRKTGGLETQGQNQNRTQKASQGLKSRTLVKSLDVIDLSDSDDD